MKKRIMVVDDEPDILTSLRFVLEKNDYEVITADNGLKCLEEIKKGFKGVILMDLMMPGLDGWETINEIVNRGLINQVEIAIITGKGTRDFQKLSLLGSYVYDYIAKPIDIDKLLASVEKCIKQLN